MKQPQRRIFLTFTEEEWTEVCEWYGQYVQTCRGRPLTMNKWIVKETMERLE